MAEAWVSPVPTTYTSTPLFEVSGDDYVALRVRARSEVSIAEQLQACGIETHCPTYLVRKYLCDRVKDTPAALFPCYLFSRYASSLRRTILTMPGVHEIVNNGRNPLPIEQGDMELIRRLCVDGLGARPFPHEPVGRRVRVERGPLAGVEGVLVQVKSQSRVALSIEALQRSVTAEVPQDWIRFLQTSNL